MELTKVQKVIYALMTLWISKPTMETSGLMERKAVNPEITKFKRIQVLV